MTLQHVQSEALDERWEGTMMRIRRCRIGVVLALNDDDVNIHS